VYNGVTLDFTIPPTPPEPASNGIGGSDESGSGLVAAFEIRRDQMVTMTLRFKESEAASVLAWLEYAQRGNTFTFRMDKNDAASAHTCYLTSPKMGDKIQLKRDGTQIGLFTLDIELRDTTGTRFVYAITGL